MRRGRRGHVIAVIYLVDITEVPDFNAMYELYDPCTVMFFYRNKVSQENKKGAERARARGNRRFRVAFGGAS